MNVQSFARHSWGIIAVLVFGTEVIADEPKSNDRYALLVGVNEYEHNKLKPLHFAENDVTDLASVLKAAQYHVTLLTNKAELKPTKANIEKQLRALLQKCKKGDTVLVALSGHGLQFEGEADAFFCPSDARPFKTATDTLVSIGKMYDEIDKSFATMKVLLVDACRDDPGAARGASRGVNSASAPPPPHGLAALFSCGAGEQAFESTKLKHGVFFYHVIQGLKGEAADGDHEVTFAGLSAYVSRRVRRDVAELIGDGATQSPNLKADYTVEPVLLSTNRLQIDDEKLREDWREYCLERSKVSVSGFIHAKGSERFAAWQAAADQGDARAQVMVGSCLLMGCGTKRDASSAFQSFRKAADQGELFGMMAVGNLYDVGSGVERNQAEAIAWIRKAAERGLPEAENRLSIMFERGNGVAKDDAEAEKWIRRAAEHGSVMAQTDLAFKLLSGVGMSKNPAEAVTWFRKAADQGSTRAQEQLAEIFEFGRDVAKDDGEAAAWYRKAAEHGAAHSQLRLAKMLEDGRGVAMDQTEAIKWYRKAAASGYTEAKKALERLGAKP